MSAHLAEVPASFGVALAAVAGLAFVYAHAGRVVVVAPAARTAAEQVRQKGERLARELGEIATVQEEIASRATIKLPASTPPIKITADAEALTDTIHRVREAFRRSAQAARMLDQAIEGSKPFAPVLERIMPGWHERTGSLHESLRRLLPDLQRLEVESQSRLQEIDEEAKLLLLRSMADQGLQSWADSLPNEEEPLVDDDDAEPIHWDRERGWQPGHA